MQLRTAEHHINMEYCIDVATSTMTQEKREEMHNIDGDYLITCQTLKEVALLRNGMKERK